MNNVITERMSEKLEREGERETETETEREARVRDVWNRNVLAL